MEGGEGKDNLIKDPVFREREGGRKKGMASEKTELRDRGVVKYPLADQ